MALPEIPWVASWAGIPDGYVVVALPEEIDLLNAPAVSDQLLTVLNRGAAGVIADMTRTRFCDAAGCRAVARASSRARLLGSSVQAVIANPFVRKVFKLTGADQFVCVCSPWTSSRGDMDQQSRPGPGTRLFQS